MISSRESGPPAPPKRNGAAHASDRADRIIMWSALGVYLAVWVWVPWAILGAPLWFVGVLWGTVYVSAHAYEIRVRGHCYMSADSTAAPAVFVLVPITYFVISAVGPSPAKPPLGFDFLAYLQAGGAAFAAGHVAALAYAALATGLVALWPDD